MVRWDMFLEVMLHWGNQQPQKYAYLVQAVEQWLGLVDLKFPHQDSKLEGIPSFS